VVATDGAYTPGAFACDAFWHAITDRVSPFATSAAAGNVADGAAGVSVNGVAHAHVAVAPFAQHRVSAS
jgi:hypothetical protein